MSGDNLRTPIDVPVVEVTLLEDRARVVRRGKLSLSHGRNRLRIDDVATVISDKTLTVRLDGGALLIDARVVRRPVPRPSDESVEPASLFDLERQLDELTDELASRRDQRALLAGQARSLEEVIALSFRDLAGDVAWGRQIGAGWNERIQTLAERERSLRQQIVEHDADTAEQVRKRKRLERRIATFDDRTEREWAGIEIDVDAQGTGSTELSVDYLVPGACWRPYHTAELIDGGARVRWMTDACVWQRTGEDWTDVELRFSTERPSLGVEPPELATDTLRARRKSDEVVVAVREQEIETTGLGGEAKVTAVELPGIDDGGDPLLVRAPSRADVPGDGKPYRVRLSEHESDAETKLVAMPELSPCVLLASTQTNRGDSPILAGPVDLIREHGLVGRTSVLFVSPDERFELGWGPEAELRIKRETESGDEKSRMLSSWSARKHKVKVFVSNIGPSERTVEITERIPISEIEKVQIDQDRDETTDRTAADENGFVRWTMTLPPFERGELKLAYSLKKHQDVRGI